MTGDQLRDRVIALGNASDRALLAWHALQDADDAASRIIAGRAFGSAVGDVSRLAHELDVDLRALGVKR